MFDWLTPFQEWLARWATPGTLGDILPWAISGVLAAIIGISKERDRRRSRKRAQAERVSAWIDLSPDGFYIARVRNSSTEPISDLAVWIKARSRNAKNPSRVTARRKLESTATLVSAKVLGPERTVDFPISAHINLASEVPEVQLGFRDVAGRYWTYDSRSGHIERREDFSVDPMGPSVMTDQDARVWEIPREGASKNGSNAEVSPIPYSRIETGSREGNNIRITLCPKGAAPRVTQHLEWADAEGVPRVTLELDDAGRVIRLGVSNLPKLVEPGAKRPLGGLQVNEHYLPGSDQYMITLAKLDELHELIAGGSRFSLNPPQFGGPLAELIFDDKSRLIGVLIHNASVRLLPGMVGAGGKVGNSGPRGS